jgi:NAD(P)-dependent dehydrogenase (short-subunit alcohol dehydrogenase family)
MQIKLKPISQQVVVITGASSGIGREFAERCAKVVAAAHGERALQSLVRQIEQLGGEAMKPRTGKTSENTEYRSSRPRQSFSTTTLSDSMTPTTQKTRTVSSCWASVSSFASLLSVTVTKEAIQ